MYTDDFLSKTQEIIKAYKNFSIFKSGSAIDKFFLCLFVFVYIVASGLLFWANVFSKNFVLFIVSLILLIVSFVATYFFQQHIWKREIKVYSKHSTIEINFLHYFEQKLNDSNILRKNYNLYIDFFTSKLDFENVFKTNELAIYLSAIVCPILINVIPDDKRIESVVLAVLGIFIIPGFIFLINWVINRKKYIYTGIIYYLNLGLLSEQFIESKTTEESK